jgi:hypothetical protein
MREIYMSDEMTTNKEENGRVAAKTPNKMRQGQEEDELLKISALYGPLIPRAVRNSFTA